MKLTDTQRDLLQTAVEEGYFKAPRRATVVDVAEEPVFRAPRRPNRFVRGWTKSFVTSYSQTPSRRVERTCEQPSTFRRQRRSSWPRRGRSTTVRPVCRGKWPSAGQPLPTERGSCHALMPKHASTNLVPSTGVLQSALRNRYSVFNMQIVSVLGFSAGPFETASGSELEAGRDEHLNPTRRARALRFCQALSLDIRGVSCESVRGKPCDLPSGKEPKDRLLLFG